MNYNAKEFDALFDSLIAQTDKVIEMNKANQFGRCGESAESELNKAGAVSNGMVRQGSYALEAEFKAPPLSNEQRPIQDSCGSTEGRAITSGQSESSKPCKQAFRDDEVRCVSGRDTQVGTQAPPAGIQPLGYVGEDGGFIPEYYEDDEPYWSDSLTTAERYGRGGK